jgi:hypothetical protein
MFLHEGIFLEPILKSSFMDENFAVLGVVNQILAWERVAAVHNLVAIGGQ